MVPILTYLLFSSAERKAIFDIKPSISLSINERVEHSTYIIL